MKAQLLIDSKCALGEGATWCAASGRFYWTDIEGRRLWRYDPRDSSRECFDMPERLACFALCAEPDLLLLGLASRLAFLDLQTGEIETIMPVEDGLPTRLNDGRCDRQGRFVFGTKHDVANAEKVGGFYRLNLDLSLERLPLGDAAIPNSIAFSPDGSTLYYCDSPTRQIRACDYDSFANQRVFAELTDASGEPDGSTIDRDGGLWNAQWGGARVVRYDADGRETARVDVPTTQPSCVAFGGSQLGTLYITSARIGLDHAALQNDLRAGGVFIATPAARGIAEPVFRGN
ncbi:SMP-30/gluconolactonase/LRE family protein [Caballeronia sp. DA-9]|uniref:SMP-30/gluconolactonase/LRE family protein n=1 Tax=Caballeronia sp. DA-9 TaxID=3436237 RepID=UPI003F666D0B